ncbi:MAG: hypothetical protein ABI321_05235 [Polyangia bacterium]
MSLAGKLALLTGSTSRIGLGIADALAGAGANLLLNGFGDEDAIGTLRATLAVKHGVTVGPPRRGPRQARQQIEARAANEGKPVEQAKHDLLAEKQPSLEFVTTEQLGALAVFLWSDAAQQIRGAAYSVDGGWVAQ